MKDQMLSIEISVETMLYTYMNVYCEHPPFF